MAALAFSTTHIILHRFILRRPPISALPPQAKQSFPRLRSAPFSFRLSTSFLPSSPPRSFSLQLVNDAVAVEEAQAESELLSERLNLVGIPPQSLSVEKKKELASSAHGLGKELKTQQVGKSGVTDAVVTALDETLEANEVVKLEIHGSCPGELIDVVKLLEETSGSVAVDQIGRTVILYRPSLSELKDKEEKKQNQILYLERQSLPKPPPISLQQMFEDVRLVHVTWLEYLEKNKQKTFHISRQ